MRWGWVVLAGSLAACSRENPWFLVDSGGGSETASSTGDADGGPSPGSSSSGEAGPGDSSGPGPVDTGEPDDTTSSSTTAVDETSTGEPMTTDGESSTGEPPEDLLVDLWELCPEPSGFWAGGTMGEVPLACGQTKPEGLRVKRYEDLEYQGESLPRVIELSPTKLAGGSVTGRYPGLTLPANLAPQARLIAEVICPKSLDPNMPCAVQADLYAEVEDAPVAVATANLADGQRKLLIAELGEDPTIAAGEPFTVFISVSVDAEVTEADRAYVVSPRIVVP